jgi:hypothetical protein
MRESEVEQYLVTRIRDLGGQCRKVQWVGTHGAPDRLIGIPAYHPKPARHAFVELKAPGKKLEPHQLREHARLAAIGLVVLVIDSKAGVDAWADAQW